MRMMWLAGGVSLLGGGAYLGGAFDRGDYYAMAPKEVEARLAGLDFGPELGELEDQTEIRLVLRSRGPSLLRWDVMSGRKRMAQVRANLAAEETGTRVHVEFQFTDGEALLGLEEDPFINEMAQIAMVEKIDSTLDRRAFDSRMVRAKMAMAVAANPQAVTEMQKSLQENVADDMVGMAGDPEFDNIAAPKQRPGKPLPPPDFSETHADGGWGKK